MIVQSRKFISVNGRHAVIAIHQTSLESALAEALHMTNLERNGDIVCMTSYAPLLAKEGHIHWNPDLIYFNNSEVHPTASYYTQMNVWAK